MNILVTGGAGYIGSHTVKELIKQKHKVIVYDDLSYGHQQAIPKNAYFVAGNLSEVNKLDKLLKKEKIQAVIHFAGFIQVGESVKNPAKYFYNNVCLGTILLDLMAQNNIHYLIFSSSAGVYGNPKKIPISETDPTNPINTYGKTKLMFEQILESFSIAHKINYCALRYFNASGANADGAIGEDHHPETHIIPLIIKSALENKPFTIFGNDYKTPDGTCIRDYIHVDDLADAHIKALNLIKTKSKNFIFNLGLGKGFSNLELVKTVEKISKKKIKIVYGARRPGDPDKLIANPAKAHKELHWQPRYKTIDSIIKTAYHWHKNRPDGFSDFNS